MSYRRTQRNKYINQIIELAERGLTQKDIAKRLGRTHQAIRTAVYEARQLGIEISVNRVLPGTKMGAIAEKAEPLLDAGLSLKEVASKMDLSPSELIRALRPRGLLPENMDSDEQVRAELVERDRQEFLRRKSDPWRTLQSQWQSFSDSMESY